MNLISLLRKHPKLVIVRRNEGLGDNLFTSAHAWYYAKKTKRSLCICWAPSRYLDDKSANAFCHFFLVPEQIAGVPVIVEPSLTMLERTLVVIPRPLKLFIYSSFFALVPQNLRRIKKLAFFERLKQMQEQWIVNVVREGRELKNRLLIFNCPLGFLPDETRPFFDALELKPEFQAEVDGFVGRYFQSKKSIGLHIRYYNKKMAYSNHTRHWLEPEATLLSVKQMIQEVVERFKNCDYVIFLATDSATVQHFVLDNFDQVVVYDKEFSSSETRELHEGLPTKIAKPAIVEMFLLAQCDILIRFPPGSWFSHYASLYVDEVIS